MRWQWFGPSDQYLTGEMFLGNMHLATHNGRTYFSHTNLVGSTRVTTDETGAVYNNCNWWPFGDQQSCTAWPVTDIGYAGYEHDQQTGLDHTWFRYYNPRLGRWMSADPLGGAITNPQSLNRFAYVLNSPTNFVDPLGLECVAGIDRNTGRACIEHSLFEDWQCFMNAGCNSRNFGQPFFFVCSDETAVDSDGFNMGFTSCKASGNLAGAFVNYALLRRASTGINRRGQRCEIEVKCRGIQTYDLGKLGMQHCDAQVTDGAGAVHSLSAGPVPYNGMTALQAWNTSPPSEPFTGSSVYQGYGCSAATCLIDSTVSWHDDPAKPEYRPVAGPNSNTWLKQTFLGCGISLQINNLGGIW